MHVDKTLVVFTLVAAIIISSLTFIQISEYPKLKKFALPLDSFSFNLEYSNGRLFIVCLVGRDSSRIVAYCLNSTDLSLLWKYESPETDYWYWIKAFLGCNGSRLAIASLNKVILLDSFTGKILNEISEQGVCTYADEQFLYLYSDTPPRVAIHSMKDLGLVSIICLNKSLVELTSSRNFIAMFEESPNTSEIILEMYMKNDSSIARMYRINLPWVYVYKAKIIGNYVIVSYISRYWSRLYIAKIEIKTGKVVYSKQINIGECYVSTVAIEEDYIYIITEGIYTMSSSTLLTIYTENFSPLSSITIKESNLNFIGRLEDYVILSTCSSYSMEIEPYSERGYVVNFKTGKIYEMEAPLAFKHNSKAYYVSSSKMLKEFKLESFNRIVESRKIVITLSVASIACIIATMLIMLALKAIKGQGRVESS
ncbi:hypothetical protein DRO21_03035 [archaeon]|nr:MAG: hypothetical protein DRO21_03035 [archaeon]RLG66780.1 MAG: hypothetical protein DRN89_00165 [archaeon]